MVSFPASAASTKRVSNPPYASAISAATLTSARTAVVVESSIVIAAATNSFSPSLP
jgi:hypothetical protein